MPVPSCLSGYRLPMPAASSTICIGSRYWRKNARQRGSASPAASLFGPHRRARAAASAVLRPRCPSAPSERRTWPAPSVCHASSPAAAGRPHRGVSVTPGVMPAAYCLAAIGSGDAEFLASSRNVPQHEPAAPLRPALSGQRRPTQCPPRPRQSPRQIRRPARLGPAPGTSSHVHLLIVTLGRRLLLRKGRKSPPRAHSAAGICYGCQSRSRSPSPRPGSR